jgi:hypothetical protein
MWEDRSQLEVQSLPAGEHLLHLIGELSPQHLPVIRPVISAGFYVNKATIRFHNDLAVIRSWRIGMALLGRGQSLATGGTRRNLPSTIPEETKCPLLTRFPNPISPRSASPPNRWIISTR